MSYQSILVIKVGTSTLSTVNEKGETVLDESSFRRIATQAQEFQRQGYGIVIVSSAAITAGMVHTNTTQRPVHMPGLQRMASIGWRLILNTWSDAFHGINVGELLVTRRELDRPQESNELMGVVDQLLQSGDVCLINENDALTHEEIAFGDNDTLAAHVAALIKQRNLASEVRFIILSDIDGVYQDKDDPNTVLREIHNLQELAHIAHGAGSSYGTGGMTTKFQAAQVALDAQVQTWIGRGKRDHVLVDLFSGETGTHFS